MAIRFVARYASPLRIAPPPGQKATATPAPNRKRNEQTGHAENRELNRRAWAAQDRICWLSATPLLRPFAAPADGVRDRFPQEIAGSAKKIYRVQQRYGQIVVRG